ncbi:FAD-dependent monooxygenase [Aromatoleum anaerobium]|nr:FAD-dependent monooxygenase [Aromatoleum anaerobium]MCK0508216.1 FAD-dependent monooxygenase [Aromatoleum anaerobium]
MKHRVAIVGAGIAAFAAALRCARQGMAVTVLAPARKARPEFPEMLSVGGVGALLGLGLQRSDLARRFPEVRERQSRWGDSRMEIRARIPGVPNPVMLGKTSLVGVLREAAVDSGADVVEIDRLTAAMQNGSGLQVTFVHDNHVHEMACSYAIDASGRPALLARQVGARRSTLDHLVAFFIRGPALPEFACFVATMSIADGWVFWACDEAGQGTCAFFTAGRKLGEHVTAASVMSRVPAEIQGMMTDTQAWAASEVEPFNCSTSALDQSCADRWLACGDALQTFDPLASRGVATALQQGDAAAQAIAAAVGGDRSVLASYREQAQSSFRRYVAERNAYYGSGHS